MRPRKKGEAGCLHFFGRPKVCVPSCHLETITEGTSRISSHWVLFGVLEANCPYCDRLFGQVPAEDLESARLQAALWRHLDPNKVPAICGADLRVEGCC